MRGINVMAVVFGVAAAGAQAAQTEHAYVAEAGLVRVERRNADFDTEFAIVGPPPGAASQISSVAYQWHYDNPPPGFSVQLCQRGGRCVGLGAESGSTQAFARAHADSAFFLRVRVLGQGPLAPVPGGLGKVIVNWSE